MNHTFLFLPLYPFPIFLPQCLQRDPKKRPSINKILARPFIKRRIASFLGNTLYADEFAHTILHSEPRLIKPADPELAPSEAAAAAPSAAGRPPSSSSAASAASRAAKSRYGGGNDITSPSAKYGVPLVRKSKSRAAAIYGQKLKPASKAGVARAGQRAGSAAPRPSRSAASSAVAPSRASPLKVAAHGIRPKAPADDRVQAFKAMEQKKVR
jgi:NIMA (never in mitosis gene a)-related kinase